MASLESVAIDARMVRHSGIGVQVRGLLWAWNRQPPPFEVTLLGDPAVLEGAVPDGLDARVIPFRRPVYSLLSLLAGPPLTSSQVFFSPHYTAPMGGLAPLVAMVHDLIHITHPTKRGTGLYMRLWLARLRGRAAFTVTPSRQTKVQLQTLHGFPAHRVLTIPPGAGLAGMVDPEPIAPGLVPDGPFVLAVGLHKPHKNWGFLIERLSGLWKSGRLDIPLVAAGLGDAGAQAIPAMAAREGVAQRVHVVPRLEDGQMAELYRRARVLAFPSLAEGFGFPVIEALRCGTPVVAANLPPMNETGGGAVAAFEPDSPASFDDALMKCVVDEEQRGKLIEAGIKRAETYRWDRYGLKMADVFERAYRQRR